MKKIDIILPCYNEEEALPLYFKNIDNILKEVKDYTFDFILVNDGSTDSTLKVMNDLYLKRNDVTIVSLSKNFGQNPALAAGLSIAKGDYVITMDSDGQDPIELLPVIASQFSLGYEVVSPHRSSRKDDSFFKRSTAGIFYSFVNGIQKKRFLPSNVNCYRGLSRRAVDELNSLTEKDKLYINEYAFIGFKTSYVNYIRPKRVAGKSKYSVSKLFIHAFNVISSGTDRPLYTGVKVGAIFSAFFLLAFIVLLVFYILGLNNIVLTNDGIAIQAIVTFLIISAIFLGASLVIFFVGLNGLYEHNILINTRNRPTFIIDTIKRPENK
ncbi:MAG: glycosyltransferase family 2 protein [Bacilli bacterium]|jgi:glycosyltransferase involved in cell wall biosynthesis